MCGIFATTQPEAWRPLLPEVLHLLRNRGPDASGEARPDPQVLLGHTRLAIIGLGPEGAQPSVAHDDTVTVAFNGEIYNYRQLADEVGLARRGSDTQVLVDLLTRRRLEDLGLLRGMYAFAAWDAEEDSLVAMRDPYGIKPLYLLQHSDGGVTLSSSLPPLLLHPDSRRIDQLGLTQYLALGHTGPTTTLFANVQKLVPGRLYRWRRNSVLGWTLDIRSVSPGVVGAHGTIADAVEDSVRAHLVADVEVGAFLSSGVDSTLISAIAARSTPGMRTFTLAFPETPELDESPLAEANAKALGTKHTKVPVTRAQMASWAAPFVREHGEPFGDAAALPLSHLAAYAAGDVKVVLCGEGADELFGGYARYRAYARLGAATMVSGILTRRLARAWGRHRSGSAAARSVEAALWGGGFRAHAALLDGELTFLESVNPLWAAQLADVMSTDWSAIANGGTMLAAAQAYDRTRWLPNVYLEKTDRATMASGLEARVPYLDARVAAAVDGTVWRDQKKTPLRAALTRIAPAVRLPDRKRGLSVDSATTVHDHLGEQFRFETGSTSSLLCRWLGPAAATQLASRAERSPSLAFRVAMLGVWEQEFSGEAFACD